jgi:hypothetical protein
MILLIKYELREKPGQYELICQQKLPNKGEI